MNHDHAKPDVAIGEVHTSMEVVGSGGAQYSAASQDGQGDGLGMPARRTERSREFAGSRYYDRAIAHGGPTSSEDEAMALERLTITPESGAVITRSVQPGKLHGLERASNSPKSACQGSTRPSCNMCGDRTKKSIWSCSSTRRIKAWRALASTDVRSLTTAVYKLVKINAELHAPPRVQLTWGSSGHLTSS